MSAKISAAGETDTLTLVWSDEFDGTTLDTTAWNYELGDGCPNLCGWGNNERQRYTRNNHRLEGGKLIITARPEQDHYTSTRITTKNKQTFRYGRVETRAKLPAARGLWPAFWMLGRNIDAVGWPRCGEVDVLEYIGRQPHQVWTSLHTQANHGDDCISKKTYFENIEEGYHTYAVDWTANDIAFLVDGEEVFSFAPSEKTEAVWPFDQEFYLLLNLAVGGNLGGADIDEAALPEDFVIDYVRVYAADQE